MRKFLCVILSIIFLFGIVSLIACAGGNMNKVTIVDKDLKDYTIVYAKYEYESIMEENPTEASYTDWDFNRLIAEELRDNIKNKFGVELQIKKDTDSTETENEILIGKTNRVKLKGVATFTPYDYKVGVTENKLFFYGGCYGTTYAATNYFLSYLDGQTDNVNIDESFELQGTHDLITIACIGASNTEGYHPQNKFANVKYWSYPATLQRLNWKTSYVYNFGASGKAMREDDTNPYKNSTQWSNCKAVAENFDHVFIQLGANDFVRDKTEWSEDKKVTFVNSFNNIISTLNQKNPNIKYTILNIWAPATQSYNPRINELLEDCYDSAVSNDYNVKYYDLASSIESSLGRNAFSSDNLHFSSEGYCALGTLIDEEIFHGIWEE